MVELIPRRALQMLDRLSRALLGDDADRRLVTAASASASAGPPAEA